MKRFKKFGTALLSCMMLTASFATVSNMTMITAEAHPGRTADIMTTRIRAVWEVIIIIVAAMRHIFIQMESARIRMGLFRMEIRPARRRHRLQVTRMQNR